MHFTFYIIIVVIMAGVDQFIKIWASSNLMGTASVTVIPKLLQLTYTENYGAAFSIFWGKRWPLILITGTVLFGLFIYLISGRCKDKYVSAGLTMIVSGGLGNLIDRIRLGYVIDYLDISPLFNYPIFNFADCLVCVGAVGLAVYVLFFESSRAKRDRT